jgi:hypothetical protein
MKNSASISPPTLDLRTQTGGECAKCLLGQHVIKVHLTEILQHTHLPTPGPNFFVQHNNHHRIVVCSEDGWAFQYHINDESVRIDRFSEGHGHVANTRYADFCAARGIQNHDFGNGIDGNGTRSIRKSTEQGANENSQQFPMIAQQAVTTMSEIFNL